MSVRIKFDSTHNAELPTLVLANRSGRFFGEIPAVSVQFKEPLSERMELRFTVNKVDCFDDSGDFNGVVCARILVRPAVSSENGFSIIGSIDDSVVSSAAKKDLSTIDASSLLMRIGDGSTALYQGERVISGGKSLITFTDSRGSVYGVDDAGNLYASDANTEEPPEYIEMCVFDRINTASRLHWNEIQDFKLVYAKEWNLWFQMYVNLEESDDIKKVIQAYSLGEEELSQIMLYNIECNTETDIARSDYIPTVLYSRNSSASLLNRLTEKAPHYVIHHVDNSIASIQRVFKFNDISILDAFKQIAEEIDCLFVIKCYNNTNGALIREINVYDFESRCLDCNSRGEFYDICSNCGSSNIESGYGEDTPILVTSENLANSITVDIDESAVKNCFRLVGGDDLMTATIINSKPDGSAYMWHFSQDMKNDMSGALKTRLDSYFALYKQYQNSEAITIRQTLVSQYNNLVSKYNNQFGSSFLSLSSNTITGYSNIMKYYYDTVDFYYYLNDLLMPDTQIVDMDAEDAAMVLTSVNMSPIAVQNLSTCSSMTADSVVLNIAKLMVDSRFNVKISQSSYSNNTWEGAFTVTKATNDADTYTTSLVTITINDDETLLLQQNINHSLANQSNDDTDICALFDMEINDFEDAITHYSLMMLNSFESTCQSCIDIIAQSFLNYSATEYMLLYRKYYYKLVALQDEIALRKSELAIIIGTYDADGELSQHGLQTFLLSQKSNINALLNLEQYLGNNLWLEFCAYRRETTFSNTNYISDGLNNAEEFERAEEFLTDATREIEKLSGKKLKIDTTLKNLLLINEFTPIINYFNVGNRIRVKVDNAIYILRLIAYELNYDDLGSIHVEFSNESRKPMRNRRLSRTNIAQVQQAIKLIIK